MKELINNLQISLFLAYRGIVRGNIGTVLMTVAMMVLAFLNLVFLSSIFTGISQAIDNQAVNLMYGNIVIKPGEDDFYIKDVIDKTRLIAGLPGVVGVAGHYVDNLHLEYDPEKDGLDVKAGSWSAKAIDVDEESLVSSVTKYVIEGRFLTENSRDEIVLGRDVSGTHGSDKYNSSLKGVGVGDKIMVSFSNGVKREYKVVGIFMARSMFADSLVYIPKGEYESAYGVNGLANEISVKLAQPNQEEKYVKIIESMGINDVDIKSWKEVNELGGGITSSFTMIKGMLSAIGMLVAAVTIFIIIFVSVVNRRKQIGIMKAIGMQEEIIIISYIWQSLFYALCGVFFGLIVMYKVIIPIFVAYPLDIPVGYVSLVLSNSDFWTASIGLVLAALIGGLIPSFMGVKESILKLIWG